MKVERSFGPLVSFAIHALILFCVFHFVSFVARDRGGEIRVQVIDPETIEIPDDWEPEEIEPPNEFDQTADMFSEMEAPDTPSEEVQDPMETSDILEDTLLSAESPIVLRNVFMGRTASKRTENMRRYGGKHGKSVEAAVMKALRWLKRNQRPDGSWAGEHSAGVTGMALLTFLAHGETPAQLPSGR